MRTPAHGMALVVATIASAALANPGAFLGCGRGPVDIAEHDEASIEGLGATADGQRCDLRGNPEQLSDEGQAPVDGPPRRSHIRHLAPSVLAIPKDGSSCLHRGRDGFHEKLWSLVEHTDISAIFELVGPNGDQGFPGTLTSAVTYRMDEARVELTPTRLAWAPSRGPRLAAEPRLSR